jgi:hypothetical protein
MAGTGRAGIDRNQIDGVIFSCRAAPGACRSQRRVLENLWFGAGQLYPMGMYISVRSSCFAARLGSFRYTS